MYVRFSKFLQRAARDLREHLEFARGPQQRLLQAASHPQEVVLQPNYEKKEKTENLSPKLLTL